MSDGYTEKVINHFRDPHNMGRMENPDGIGKVGNPVCGDVMWIYIKVNDNIITDCSFETFGCVAAVATSSILTDLVKGKTLEEALKVSNKDVIAQLGGLPSAKTHCSVLAEQGIKSAILDYQKRKNSNDINNVKKNGELQA